MTNVSGLTFTKTITGQTLGSTINYGVKFAYAGGLSVTKYVSYVVGSNCTFGINSTAELVQFYFPNPTSDYVTITSNQSIEKVEIHDLLGNMVLNTSTNTNKVDVTNLSKGIYLVTAYSGSEKSTKKIVIN
jgi:hypothetical protein